MSFRRRASQLTLVLFSLASQVDTWSLHAADERTQGIRDHLVGQIEKGTSTSIQRALRGYNSAERQRGLDIFAKHSIHVALVKAFQKADGETIYKVAKSTLKKGTTSTFPAQVVVLKVLGKSRGKIELDQLADLFLKSAKNRDRRISTWAVRIFADLDEAQAIDALIDLLAVEEKEGRYFGDLASVIQGELYRVLGSLAMGDSFTIRKNWEKAGKKIPKNPDYSLSGGGEGRGKTVFFGDRLATRAVFCIDISSSMRGEVKMGKSADSAPKIDIVKAELGSAVGGLTPDNRFNIISYDKACAPWKNPRQMVSGTSSNVGSAKSFAGELAVGSGTNIHDAMVLGLRVDGVETIYLLSDGAPSVGGNPAQIRKRVQAMNYLLGVRVVTYGFTGSDEQLMRDLAKKNWGWYRALNK